MFRSGSQQYQCPYAIQKPAEWLRIGLVGALLASLAVVAPTTQSWADEGDDDGSFGILAEGDPDLALQVVVFSDGTEAWDADDTAGNDSAADNGIVRVNDTVTYKIQYSVATSDAQNLTWSITFPKGMELTEIPGCCLSGSSSLLPASAGTRHCRSLRTPSTNCQSRR